MLGQSTYSIIALIITQYSPRTGLLNTPLGSFEARGYVAVPLTGFR